MKHLLIIFAIIMSSSVCVAQNGLGIGAHKIMPVGDLYKLYQSSTGYSVGFFGTFTQVTASAFTGYHSYAPLQQTYKRTYGDTGTATLGNYSVIPLQAGLAINMGFLGLIKFYVGADIGMFVTTYSYTFKSPTANIDERFFEFMYGGGPKIGLTIKLPMGLHIMAESKFSLYQIEDIDEGGTAFLGETNYSWTNGIRLVYNIFKDNEPRHEPIEVGTDH